MPPSSTCTASRKPDGYNKAHLQKFGEVLQAWMISQIPGGATALEQLVCIASGFREAVGMTLKGLAIETEDGHLRFVAQFTVYARALGVALAQKTYDTHASSERAALKELLSTMDLDGKLILADALHTTRPFFSGAWSRGRRAPERQIQPEDPPPSDRLSVGGKAQGPFHGNGSGEAPWARYPLGDQGQRRRLRSAIRAGAVTAGPASKS